MFVKILFKEWRENILVFVLALLLFVLLIGLNLSDQPEMNLYYSGMFLLLFLPMASALIGSGAFNSEFKDNAWVYLLSRPISRKKIFIYKYLSQLSILGVIITLFILVGSSLPRLRQIIPDIKVGGSFNLGFATLPFYFVIPLLIFSLAFSLSILYEKQFVLVFAAIFIGAGFSYLALLYSQFVLLYYSHWGSLRALPVFITLSFLAASFLTFLKSDFSQMRPKVFLFLRYLGIFLLLTFFIQTVWIARGNLFSGNKEFSTWGALKQQKDFYAPAGGRGLLKYDYTADEVVHLNDTGAYFWFDFAVGGDKVAVFKDIRSRSQRWAKQLWIMNTDGSGGRVLVESRNEDSPFYGKEFSDKCLLSMEGKSIIFATLKRTRQPLKTAVTLSWMNLDANGIKSQTIELEGNCWNFQPFAWQPEENWLCLGYEKRSISNRKIRDMLIKISLNDGSFELLSDIVSGFFGVHVSPQQDLIAFRARDPQDGLGKLMVIDLRTGEKEVLRQERSLPIHLIKWESQGLKLAFFRPRKLYVYDVERQEIVDAFTHSTVGGLSFDWAGDSLVLLREDLEMKSYVEVLGPDFKRIKEIPLPSSIKFPARIWGLKGRALVSTNLGGPLWRVDLQSGEWKKVY